MRLAITYLKDSHEQWHPLCGPDVSLGEQIQLVKDIARTNGAYQDANYAEILCLSTSGTEKRMKFKPIEPIFVAGQEPGPPPPPEELALEEDGHDDTASPKRRKRSG